MDKEPIFSPEQFIAWLFQGSSYSDSGIPFDRGIPRPEGNTASDSVTAGSGYSSHNGSGNGSRANNERLSDDPFSDVRFAEEIPSEANYNWVELESLILDSFDAEAIDQVADLLQGFSPLSGQTTFKLGEQFTVQDRFYRLIKQRLETEIQRRPPLFPWETELSDYESEAVTESIYAADAAPAIEEKIPLIWAAQLGRLNLPISMPVNLLSQLLVRCQSVMQSQLREGAKLVQAVEAFFPEELPLLNELAARVLVSPARSPMATWQGLPQNYQAANSKQQMVLSLLAAKEILKSLSLPVSQAQPILDREWLTEIGLLSLQVQYVAESNQIQVQAQLPCGGSLKLKTIGSQAMTFRAGAGSLSAAVFDVQPGQSTILEVRLEDVGQEPLMFTIDAH